VADGEKSLPKATLIGPKNYRTVWQKMLYEAAQGQKNARDGAVTKPAITAKTVLGAPRPEFGPPGSAIGIKIENGHPVYRPNDMQKDVAKEHLAIRGLPTKQVDDVKFVGALTWMAYRRGGEAVTQGSTVYIRPEKFLNYADFKSKDPFEEIYHGADFAAEGGAGFYNPYGFNSIGGLLATGDDYYGNPQEAFAKGAAKEMYETHRYRKRALGK
jgi:hypothetical protein